MGVQPAHRWALSLVLVAVVADYVGVTMMRVTLPFYAKALGGSGVLIGSLETAYGIGQWLGAVSLPRLSDVWGRRRVLFLCCSCSAFGYGLAIVSLIVESPLLLLISRLPVGLAKQTVTISRAVVADCTEANEDRSRWMAFQCTALAVGCSVGPILASQASERFSEIAPLAIAASMFVVLAPMVLATMVETSPKVPSDHREAVRGPPLWRNRRVVVVLLILALPELGLVAHQGVTLNTFSMQYLGMGKMWIANVNAISAVMQATFAGTVCSALASRGWRDVTLLQLGALSFAFASLSIWWWQSPAAVIYSAPLAAMANSVLRSFPAALLSKHVPEYRQGEAMGLLDVSSSALRILAPVLAGAFMDSFGGGAVFLGQAVLFVVACIGLRAMSYSSSKVSEDTPHEKAS